MEVHQILPALSYGDAVSNDALAIRDVLRDYGIKSEIFAKHHDPRVSKFVRPLEKYPKNPSNVIFYHFSSAGKDVTEYVKSLPGYKVLIYHNVTPPEFFYLYDKTLALLCLEGKNEIKTLVPHFDLALGDSEYNRQDLERYGFVKTDVLPIFIGIHKYDELDFSAWESTRTNGTTNILFVGRLAPNKRQEDVIKAFYCYHRYINENSKLFLVGSSQISLYVSKLKKLISNLELSDAVVFTGMVNEKELIQYYKNSHVFVCMSEHEGFCVPLLEAMYFNLPVIAYNAAAVPFTLGNSGILLNQKDYVTTAELINLVIENNEFRSRLILEQKKQLDKFDFSVTRIKLKAIIESISVNRHRKTQSERS